MRLDWGLLVSRVPSLSLLKPAPSHLDHLLVVYRLEYGHHVLQKDGVIVCRSRSVRVFVAKFHWFLGSSIFILSSWCPVKSGDITNDKDTAYLHVDFTFGFRMYLDVINTSLLSVAVYLVQCWRETPC